MNWRPHTEKPQVADGTTALLAYRDGVVDDDILLAGIYMWVAGRWVDEIEDRPLNKDAPYWWCLESEIVAEIKA